MPILKFLTVAFAASVLAPLAASAMTTQQAYAQCRARHANLPDMPGSGNPVKEGIIEGCVQELMSRQQNNPPQRTRTKGKSGAPAER